jgi:hypothetical protein
MNQARKLCNVSMVNLKESICMGWQHQDRSTGVTQPLLLQLVAFVQEDGAQTLPSLSVA